LIVDSQSVSPTVAESGVLSQTREMTDDQGKRLAALRNRGPNSVVITLYVIAAFAAAFGGYTSGAESHRGRLPIFVMGLLVSIMILLVLDLDRPNLGFIEVSQRPMADVVASIRSYTE
jgi:Na+/glutamate symporter